MYLNLLKPIELNKTPKYKVTFFKLPSKVVLCTQISSLEVLKNKTG